MHTLRFLLQTTKSDDYEINRRFYAYYKLYNIAVKYVRKRMTRLSRHALYQQYRSEYVLLLKRSREFPNSFNNNLAVTPFMALMMFGM